MKLLRTGVVFASAVLVATAACSGLPLIGDDDEKAAGPAAPAATTADASPSTSTPSPPTGTDGSTAPVAGEAPVELHKSGSRLKARFLRGDDGTVQFMSWTDTARNGDECAFSIHVDGTLRCMPPTSAIFGGLFGSADCTGSSVAYQLKGNSAPKYALKYDAPGTRRYPVLAPYAGPVSARHGTTGQCQDSSTVFSSPTYDLFTIGEEVSSSSFVKGSIETSP